MRSLTMRWTIRLGLVLVLFAAVFSVIYPSARQSAFGWFDAQDYPDLGELPLIEIDTPFGAHRWFAFLKKDNSDRFSTLELDLLPATYSKTIPTANFYSFRVVEPRDLDDNVLGLAQNALMYPLRGGQKSAKEIFAARVVKLFVLARGLERHGRPDLAEVLFKEARKVAYLWSPPDRHSQQRLPGKFGARHFIEELNEDIQAVKKNKGRVMFGLDPE